MAQTHVSYSHITQKHAHALHTRRQCHTQTMCDGQRFGSFYNIGVLCLEGQECGALNYRQTREHFYNVWIENVQFVYPVGREIPTPDPLPCPLMRLMITHYIDNAQQISLANHCFMVMQNFYWLISIGLRDV